MVKPLQTSSTLTDRYQTTVPETVRELLHLQKRDKIAYSIDENGRVFISRISEEDPALGDFLNLLANDIKKNPSNLHSISPALIARLSNLTAGVEVDLDSPLDDKDE